MWLLVIYDIRDERRLQKVAKFMEGYGKRVQKSIFECYMDHLSFKQMKKDLENIIEIPEDSVKYFRLCSSCWEKALAIGQSSRMIEFKEVEIL